MVKQATINFGRIKQGQSIDLEWDLNIPEKDVVHFVVDCGCTAQVRAEDGKIKATFNEDEAQNLNDEQKQKWYPEGFIPVAKGITVYLNDGKNLVVLDENNNQVFNPEKQNERIMFVGEVEYEPVVQNGVTSVAEAQQ